MPPLVPPPVKAEPKEGGNTSVSWKAKFVDSAKAQEQIPAKKAQPKKCVHYARGFCYLGGSCAFLHPADCIRYARGNCTLGDDCPRRHLPKASLEMASAQPKGFRKGQTNDEVTEAKAKPPTPKPKEPNDGDVDFRATAAPVVEKRKKVTFEEGSPECFVHVVDGELMPLPEGMTPRRKHGCVEVIRRQYNPDCHDQDQAIQRARDCTMSCLCRYRYHQNGV